MKIAAALFPLLLTLCVSNCFVRKALSEGLSKKKIPIPIGIIAPLTGGLAARGDDIAKLTKILEADFSRSKKLTHRYRFFVEDGKCGAGNAASTAAMKLIHQQKVKFLITACSGETLQTGPLAEKNKVILFAVLSLHPDIRSLGEYIFRTFIDIEKSIAGFAHHMSQGSDKRIAILTEENAFTLSVRDLLIRFLGKQIVFSDEFPADSADFNTFFAKIKSSGANGIYFNAMSEGTLANLVNQAKRFQMKQKLYSYNMPEAPSFREATASNSDHLEFIGTPSIKNSSAEYQRIFKEFLHEYPQGPSYEFMLRTTFDAISAIIDQAEQYGEDTEKIKSSLLSYSKMGALGKVEFDENGDIKNLHYVLTEMGEDGKTHILAPLVQ